MMNNLKIATRLTLGIVLLLAGLTAMLIPAVTGQLSELSRVAELRQLTDLHHTLQQSINTTSKDALVAVDAVISAPGVAAALADRARPRLQELTLPVFTALKARHNVQQFQFHLPPATSFLRLHKLEQFGDDLSSFRATVVKANQTRQPQTGLENGVAGLGLRGVIPVMHQGAHVGSVELGLSFGQDFFDQFTRQYGAPSALHVKVKEGFKTFASTLSNKTTLSDADMAAVLKGGTITRQVDVGGRKWSMMAKPALDFSNNPIGVVEILVDRSEYAKAYDATLRNILLLGAGALLLGVLLAWRLAKTITRPITELTAVTEAISRGKFDTANTGVDRQDEIGALSRGVARMSKSIQVAMDRLRKAG